MITTNKKKTIIKHSANLQWKIHGFFFLNKNNVSVSEPLDGTIENLLRRDCSDKMLEKALKENLPFPRL